MVDNVENDDINLLKEYRAHILETKKALNGINLDCWDAFDKDQVLENMKECAEGTFELLLDFFGVSQQSNGKYFGLNPSFFTKRPIAKPNKLTNRN